MAVPLLAVAIRPDESYSEYAARAGAYSQETLTFLNETRRLIAINRRLIGFPWFWLRWYRNDRIISRRITESEERLRAMTFMKEALHNWPKDRT